MDVNIYCIIAVVLQMFCKTMCLSVMIHSDVFSSYRNQLLLQMSCCILEMSVRDLGASVSMYCGEPRGSVKGLA